MKKIKEIGIKIYNSIYFPFLVLFLVQLGLNFFKTIGFGDDTWFREILSNKEMVPSGTVTEYLKWRYDTWTSRIIIEFFLVNLLQLNVIIWKIFDAVMLTVLGIAIYKVFVSRKIEQCIVQKINWIIIILLLSLPLEMFTGAGWIATFTNYLLPISLGIVTLIPLRKILCEEKIKKFEYLLYIVACLIATNMEQMCAVLFIVFFIFTIYCIIKKKKNIIIPLLLIVTVFNLINIVICPGNDIRSEREMKNCYLNFEKVFFIEKVFLGIASMMQFCLIDFNLVYTIFTGVMMFVILSKYKDVVVRMIGIFPFVIGIAFNILITFTQTIAPDFTFLLLKITNEIALNQSEIILSMNNFIVFAIYIMTILCLFISLILIFGKRCKTIIAILVLGAGICSKIMLGFSATVWASGNRTGFVLMVSMIITTILILEEQKKNVIDKFLTMIMICGIFSLFEKGTASFIK